VRLGRRGRGYDGFVVVFRRDAGGLAAEERDAAAPEKLIEYLGLCGIKGAEAVNVPRGREGPPLVDAARHAGARLLVAGAYGHSRLREWVFGGATRSLIEAADGPHLLIAH
jgi:nucleotide-binding universal stress UspA family protein